MSGYLYWGRGANVLAGEGADGLAEGEVADGLALADGVANDEDLEDFGDVNDDLEDLGVDGELSSSSVNSCCEEFLNESLVWHQQHIHNQQSCLDPR